MKKFLYFLILTAIVAFSYTKVFPEIPQTDANEPIAQVGSPQAEPLPESIPVETQPEQSPATAAEPQQLLLEPTTYTVQSGDNLGSIAKKFDISLTTILSANNLTSKSIIHIGDTLIISPASGISYKIKSGDTILGIALRYNITQEKIFSTNKLSPTSILHLGQTIILPNASPITTQAQATTASVTPKAATIQPKVTTVTPTDPAPKASRTIQWSSSALQELNKIPSFVRPSVKSKIEAYAREHGITVITKEVYNSIHI